MFINKLNQMYKPDRILYYTEVKDHVIPDEINLYANAFGTYDAPGIFFIKGLGEVAGIEFRADDDQITYPQNLKSKRLVGAFFYTIEIDNDFEISDESIHDLFKKMGADNDAYRIYSDFSIREDSDVIGVFACEKKLRILYECELVRNDAGTIIRDEVKNLSKDQMYKLAFFDPITEHYNWNHLEAFIEMPQEKGIQDYAFVHFDIKEFRVLNEVYGHIAANAVLKKIVDAMNEADFVYASARCHNDNFAMMIRDMPEDEMMAKLEDFFEKLSHLKEDENYTILFRCGVVPMQMALQYGNRVADAGKLAQSLGTHADRTDIIFYTDQMHEDIQWGNYIKAYVDTAIERDEFMVYLQPKFDIGTEKIKGAEALIRWNYKNSEFLAPYRFIPFFEKDGSIGKIDDIVLNKVCQAFEKWKNEGRELYPISVNLSRQRLYDNHLVDNLTKIVDRYNVDHKLIDFELTESATYDDMDRMLQVLYSLRDHGFRISMDDFGTGYSSLSLLTEMPLDTLKIDKSFVDHVGMGDERVKDITVIRHIIALAKELEFTCLAEGAEEKCQVERLKELGCEVIQGYYFSKPIPINEYEEKYL